MQHLGLSNATVLAVAFFEADTGVVPFYHHALFFHKSATALSLQCDVYAANFLFQRQQHKGKVTVQATGKFPFDVSACFTYFED